MSRIHLLLFTVLFGLISLACPAATETAAKEAASKDAAKAPSCTLNPIPDKIVFMYGYNDTLGDDDPEAWARVEDHVNVIEGITKHADWVKQLRAAGKVFAHNRKLDLKKWIMEDKEKSDEEKIAFLVSYWSEPFKNTLDGELPEGFDAIAIDEFTSHLNDSEEGNRLMDIIETAIVEVKKQFPNKIIITTGAMGINTNLNVVSGQVTYQRLFRLIEACSELYLQQHYINYHGERGADRAELIAKGHSLMRMGLNRTSRKFGFPNAFALLRERSPAVFAKTIPLIGIAEREGKNKVYQGPAAKDDKKARESRENLFNPKDLDDFGEFVRDQITFLATHSPTKELRGVGFWVYYRAEQDVVEMIVEEAVKHWPIS